MFTIKIINAISVINIFIMLAIVIFVVPYSPYGKRINSKDLVTASFVNMAVFGITEIILGINAFFF